MLSRERLGSRVGQAWQGLMMARGEARRERHSRPQSGGFRVLGGGRRGQERLNSNKSETERQGREETDRCRQEPFPPPPPPPQHTHTVRDTGRPETEGEHRKTGGRTDCQGHEEGEGTWGQLASAVSLGTAPGEREEGDPQRAEGWPYPGGARKAGWAPPIPHPTQDSRTQAPRLS